MKITQISIYSLCAVLTLSIAQITFSAHTATAENDILANSVKQDVNDTANNVDHAVNNIKKETKLEEKAARQVEKADAKLQKSEEKNDDNKQKVAKLDGDHLEYCKKKQSLVIDVMHNSARQGLNQLDVFKQIADRTMAFYQSKGNTVSNYDALVADANAKYDAAQSVVTAIDSTSSTFDCNGDNPKEALVSFRDSNHAKNDALKQYRTAVKNLIIAVKSAQSPEVEAR